MRKYIYFLVLVSISSIFNGCNIINPDEPIPSYIHIDTIILKANGTGNERDLTHNFTDVIILINDNDIGTYELPVTIPALYSDKQTIKVAAGIKINGVNTFRTDYPFIELYKNDSSFSLTKEAITTITPVVQYYDNIKFAWIEDFENSTMSIKTTSKSENEIILTTADTKSGNFAGEINLSDSANYFEAYSELAYILPNGDKPIFLEMDYKIEEKFYVGLKAFKTNGTSSETTLVGIEPKHDDNGNLIWNKIYIELASEVSAYYNSDAISFQVAFSAIKSNDKSTAKILIDNVKLLYANE